MPRRRFTYIFNNRSNNMNNEPENKPEEEPQQEPRKESILDSINFVVDMMNSGQGDPDKIYPKNRYHGD